MTKYLEFDPKEIEEDVYSRMPEGLKNSISNSALIKEINMIRIKKASKILEDKDVNTLNFQMF